ncbi:MAG: hypothetical protein ISP56_01690 [Flavobacteriaceae bacterium]|nr:hypothetical protein [Flavobacteriaceae bacterium]
MLKFKFISIIIAFSFFTKIYSQSVINVESKADTTSIKVGEKIKYEFSFSIDSLSNLSFEIRNFNPPFEIIEDFQMDTLYSNNQVSIIKKYHLTSFESGSYSITPPLIIRDNIIKLNDSIVIDISTVDVDTVSKKFFDIKNIIPFSKNNDGWWKKYFLIISFISIMFLLWILYKNSNFFGSNEIKLTPPIEKAIQALQHLDFEKLSNQSDYKLYYSKLTEIVKNYLEEDVKMDAIESTSDELIEKLKLLKGAGKLDIDNETLKNFHSVLSNADLVKFAKSNPGPEVAIRDKKILETVLVDTKEAIPAPTEEELLKSEKYLIQIRKEKNKKLIINFLKFTLIGVFVLISSSIAFFGWEEVKDNVFGNKTKTLLESKDWVTSTYGAYPITISSPDVLIRVDSEVGQSFEFQSLENSFYVSLITKPANNDEDLQNILLNHLKEKGALNILSQQDEFVLENGITTVRYFGSFDYINKEGNVVKKEYSNLIFFEKGGSQTVTCIIDRNNKYASQIITRLKNSINFKSN